MSSDSPLNAPGFYGVFAGFFGAWVLACVVSTRGCRDCSYNGRSYQEGAWGRDRRPQDQDEILARRLQREELEENSSPEEAAAEKEQKIRKRREFVEKVVQHRTIESPMDASHHSETEQCTICLTDFECGDSVSSATTKLCEHNFHFECIKDWLVRRRECPVCRVTFLKEDIKDDSLGEEERAVEIPPESNAADEAVSSLTPRSTEISQDVNSPTISANVVDDSSAISEEV